MEGVNPTTGRPNHGAAKIRGAVAARARIARDRGLELGQGWGQESLTLVDKIRLAYWNAFQHDCINTAKATAYSSIFAIFPVLGVVAALIALVPYTGPVRTQISVFMGRVLPAGVDPLFEHYFTTVHSSRQSAGVLLVALMISVSGAAGVLATLMEGFRRAYNLTDECWGDGWRGQVRKQVQSFVLVPVAVLPMAIASALVVFGHFLLISLMHYSPSGWDVGLYFTANVIRWVASLGTTAAVLAFIYRYAVPVNPPWRAVVPGAALATGTWFLSTLLFGWYVTRFANYSRVYGSLGTGISLLLWLFITSLMVLCGAELNAELGRERVVIRPSAGTGIPAASAIAGADIGPSKL